MGFQVKLAFRKNCLGPENVTPTVQILDGH